MAPLHPVTTYPWPEHQGTLDFEEQYGQSGRREKEKDKIAIQIAKLTTELELMKRGQFPI